MFKSTNRRHHHFCFLVALLWDASFLPPPKSYPPFIYYLPNSNRLLLQLHAFPSLL
ncbi:hypothetical protein AAHE18_04G106800 [Arachis hypogaea]